MRIDTQTTDGVAWQVRRRVVPWRRKMHRKGGNADVGALDIPSGRHSSGGSSGGSSGWSIGDLNFVDFFEDFFIVVGLILLAVFFAVVIVPLLAIGFELLLLLLLLPLFLLARYVGILRWPIEIRREGRLLKTSYVRGSGQAIMTARELAADIARGTDEQATARYEPVSEDQPT